MEMRSVVILKKHNWENRTRKPGDKALLRKDYVPLLSAMGLVREEFSPVVKKPLEAVLPPAPIVTAIEYPVDPLAEDNSETEKKPRRYRRRDLEAED
jgi:hypothetical protein